MRVLMPTAQGPEDAAIADIVITQAREHYVHPERPTSRGAEKSHDISALFPPFSPGDKP
jgi:hypothetical protein